MTEYILQAIQLCKHYDQAGDQVVILDNVSLDLATGTSSLLIGPSGSGKSTFLNVIGLLDKIDSGSIFINGTRCDNLSNEQQSQIRRDCLGFIYQSHYLLNDFTVLENTKMPLLISGISEAEAEHMAIDVLEKLGLKHRLNYLCNNLSGGEQQRVAIARAIVKKPKIILADEPTGNLDPKNADLIFRILLDLVKEFSLSTLIVTHNLKYVEMVDQVFKIENGSILKV